MPIRALGFIVLQKLKEIVKYYWVGSIGLIDTPTDRAVFNVSRLQPKTVLNAEQLGLGLKTVNFYYCYDSLRYFTDALPLELTTPTAEILASDLIQREVCKDVEPAPSTFPPFDMFIESIAQPTAEPTATEFLSVEVYYTIGG